MNMLGINNAEHFKTQILKQREMVIHQKHSYGNAQLTPSSTIDNTQLLTDIKNELIEIKKVLNKNNS